MTVLSAIIDLTDEDDVMYVDGRQVTEETVTSPSWTSVISNANEHKNEQKNEQMAPDQVSHEERETVKDTAIGKQHTTSKYPAISDEPNQPRHFNFPKRRFGASKIVIHSFQGHSM